MQSRVEEFSRGPFELENGLEMRGEKAVADRTGRIDISRRYFDLVVRPIDWMNI